MQGSPVNSIKHYFLTCCINTGSGDNEQILDKSFNFIIQHLSTQSILVTSKHSFPEACFQTEQKSNQHTQAHDQPNDEEQIRSC